MSCNDDMGIPMIPIRKLVPIKELDKYHGRCARHCLGGMIPISGGARDPLDTDEVFEGQPRDLLEVLHDVPLVVIPIWRVEVVVAEMSAREAKPVHELVQVHRVCRASV